MYTSIRIIVSGTRQVLSKLLLHVLVLIVGYGMRSELLNSFLRFVTDSTFFLSPIIIQVVREVDLHTSKNNNRTSILEPQKKRVFHPFLNKIGLYRPSLKTFHSILNCHHPHVFSKIYLILVLKSKKPWY